MSADPVREFKVCPICEHENPPHGILCEKCFLDLSFTQIIAPGISSAGQTEAESAPPSLDRRCENGHSLQAGDLMCLECGAPPASDSTEHEPGEPEPVSSILTCGDYEIELPESASEVEFFLTEHEGRQVRIFPRGLEPDAMLQERLSRVHSDQVATLIEKGHAEEDRQRFFEIWAHPDWESLAGSDDDFAGNLDQLERIALHLVAGIEALHEQQILLRNLNREAVRYDNDDEGEFHLLIADLGQAAVADLGISREPTRTTPAFLAPEAAVGVYEEASDWWSMGALLLDLLTGDGEERDAFQDHTVLLNVVTRGIPVSDELPGLWSHLLKGLLTRDPAKRWSGDETRRWLLGERGIPHFYERDRGSSHRGKPISLGNESCHSPEQWALAAAGPDHWDEARRQLESGSLGTWLDERDEADQAMISEVDRLRRDETIEADERLAAVAVFLNPRLPLSFRGAVVNPRWLLEQVEVALRWLEGEFTHRLDRIERIEWLVEMGRRRERAENLAKEKSIPIDRDAFRAASLVADHHQLHQNWTRRRRSFPVAHHRGLASLAEKDSPLPEELVILVSTELQQFTPAALILSEAREEADRAGAAFYNEEAARSWFERSHRDIYRNLNERLGGFVRCGEERLDEWADEFRFERRLSLPRALVLLQVAEDDWQTPPEQEYLGNLFEFFHRKILRGIQQGPLLRLRVSKNSRNIDLAEIGGPQLDGETLLGRVFSREPRESQLDPSVFIENPGLERRIRRLHRVGVDYQRDTGIDSVYLGFPFLLFRPKSSSVTAKPKRAPIFLWPLEIHAQGGMRGRIRIGFDHKRSDEFETGSVILNPALQPLLKQDEADALRDALAEGLARSQLDAAGLYDLCAAALATKTRHDATLCRLPGEAPEMQYGEGHLFPAGAFFLCDFSQQTIANDITQLRNRGLKSGALANALRLPGETAEPGSESDSEPPVPETEKFFVLPADPSQQRAVLQARQPRGVVIQGPPGTGKSQTIVNILADCIGRGEKALVVCQKHAALDVVARRLAEEGLSDRFFQVEDAKRSRQPIIRALRGQTEASAPWRTHDSGQSRDELAARIERLETELCASADAIQKEIEPSQLTYAEIMDRLIDGGSDPRINAFDLRDGLGQMAHEEVRSAADSIGSLAALWYRSHFFDSPWDGLKDFSPDPAAISEFEKTFASYESAEKERNTLFVHAGRIFQILDPAAMREWIGDHRERLRKMPDEVVTDAHRWRDIFVAEGEGESTRLTADLESIASEAGDLKFPPRNHDLGPPVSALAGRPFRDLSKASRKVRAAAKSLFRRLLPPYLLAKLALKRFYNQHSDFSPGEGNLEDELAPLHEQFDWESARRSLHARLQQALATLGESGETDSPTDRPSPREIRSEADALVTRISTAEKAARLRFDCPVPKELDEAFSKHRASALTDFLEASDISLTYSGACFRTLETLPGLAHWFSEDWIARQTRHINEAVPSEDEIKKMQETIDTVPDFLHFRIRFRDLPQLEQTLFKSLEPYRDQLDPLPEEQLESVLRNTIHREALLAWKGLAESRSPALLMDSAEFESKVASLRQATEHFRKATAERLRRPWRPEIISNATNWMEILMLRGARALRLREIFDKGIEKGLFHLRPIWLASPETVSRVFPLRENLFDVVIFDEASQIPVELAIPALYRARRAIVSGDEKQLPPTNFFRSSFDDEDEDDPDELMLDDGSFLDADLDDDTRDRLERKMTRREVKDCGDLLQLAGSEMPSRLLTIHYRSRWRHLIGFSNHAFYEGKLSVPVHHPDERVQRHQPIEIRHFDSPYMNQTNEGEADAIIEFLAEHWQQDEPPSIGIVTFNLKQSELIQDKIEERMESDAEFRKNCERDRQRSEIDGYFVRNLENVQGDERDVIIFSTTFGPDVTGRFVRNFGPAGQKGGERRLNVAVTRSRDKMIVFTSLPIAEIASGLPGEGTTPREILKAYLSYADAISRGDFESARAIQTRSRGRQHHAHDRSIFAGETEQRAFVREVGEFLTTNGFSPEADDSRDAFHFDLALVDRQTEAYGLAIECDPPLHPDLDSARAREIWRPDTMRGTIPHLIRLSSRAWLDNEDSEKKRLLAAAHPFR